MSSTYLSWLVGFCLLTNGLGFDRVLVKEGSDVVLPCSTAAGAGPLEFNWDKDGRVVFVYVADFNHNRSYVDQDEQFKGRISHFHEERIHGNVSVKIHDVKASDSGNYTCTVSALQEFQRFHVELVVGAIPNPVIRINAEDSDWSDLQCEVRCASPKPTVEWQDGAGNVLLSQEPQVTLTGGCYDIVLVTAVTKTDRFRCVVRQEEINHEVSAETYVHVRELLDSSMTMGWLLGLLAGLTLGSIIFAVVLHCLIVQKQLIILCNRGPVVVKEEKDAVLPCSLKDTPLNYQLFDWKKGRGDQNDLEVFLYDAGIHYNNGRGGQDPQFKGRVSHFQDELQHGNASIKIRNTKVEDSGDYSCVFPRLQSPENHVELIVERVLKDRSAEILGAASKPSFPRDFEGTEAGVILQCDVRDASPMPRVEWRDRAGRLLHAEEPQVTEVKGYFNVTLLSWMNQSGRFHCVVTQEEIHHQVSAETNVHIIAVAEPCISVVQENKERVQLRCHIPSAFPKPTVKWHDRAGNVLCAGEPQVSQVEGGFSVTLDTTVTSSGHYRCVITQEEINHLVSAETYVVFRDCSPSNSGNNLSALAVLSVVAVVSALRM
ncbi:uncharacterized protein V6R79_009039 [Siganus canaliculatus]